MGLLFLHPASWASPCHPHTREPGFSLCVCSAICCPFPVAWANGRIFCKPQLTEERTPPSRGALCPGSFVKQVGDHICRFPRLRSPLCGLNVSEQKSVIPRSLITFMITTSPAPQRPHKPMERPTLLRKSHFLWFFHVQTFKSPLTHKFPSSYTLWHKAWGPEFPGEAGGSPGNTGPGNTALHSGHSDPKTGLHCRGHRGTELGQRWGDPGPATHRVFLLGGHS